MDGSGVSPSIWKIADGIDVEPLLGQLDAHPQIWNQRVLRTRAHGESPHKQVDDVWVRFRPWDEVIADPAHCCDKHESVWYPVVKDIPAVVSLVDEAIDLAGATELGGVLITRIGAGKRVAPHQDHGWHAHHYRKIAVQIKGDARQAFCFEDIELRPETGDVYEFINQRTHWVLNDSDEERISLIVCLK
jgi:hypothetical protein